MKINKILISIISALAIFGTATAQTVSNSTNKLWVSFPVASKHTDPGYKEFNPGIGFEYGSEKLRAYGMGYVNSFNRWTNSYGVLYRLVGVGKFHLDGMVGAAQGYWTGSQWRAIAAPRVSYETGKVAFDFYAFPPIEVNEKPKTTALGFALRFKL